VRVVLVDLKLLLNEVITASANLIDPKQQKTDKNVHKSNEKENNASIYEHLKRNKSKDPMIIQKPTQNIQSRSIERIKAM